MIADYYDKIPKRARIAVIFAAIVLVGYFIFHFASIDPKSVPEEFLMARQEASLIASEIVSLSDESAANLSDILRFDQEQKYSEALALISEELERNRQAREKAIGLSSQLEIMATNISGISPDSAGQAALQAVSSEAALISRLITYNDYLNQLLEALREKLTGISNGNSIPDLVSKINDEAKAINDLDKKFNDLIKEFDSF
jgi:predicted RND superfamily exporter protein